MGSCCSKKHLTKRKAFRQELGAPLLDSVSQDLGRGARVVVVRLVSLKNIAPYGISANSFVQFRLMPADDIAGAQQQSSSIIPGTTNPHWEPPEKFQFVISDMSTGRLLVSVYHYDEDRPKENFPIGDVALKLDALKLSSDAQKMTFKLVNPTNGQTEGEATLSLQLRTVKEAQEEMEETVYEYQEWGVLSDWDAMAHPGRWSTADGKTFTDELEQAGSKVPEGWEVSSTWSIMSTSFDPDGWQYATRLDSANWYPENNNALFVIRRRSWHRAIHKAKGSKRGVFGGSKKK